MLSVRICYEADKPFPVNINRLAALAEKHAVDQVVMIDQVGVAQFPFAKRTSAVDDGVCFHGTGMIDTDQSYFAQGAG
jgi:hypothetical protein